MEEVTPRLYHRHSVPALVKLSSDDRLCCPTIRLLLLRYVLQLRGQNWVILCVFVQFCYKNIIVKNFIDLNEKIIKKGNIGKLLTADKKQTHTLNALRSLLLVCLLFSSCLEVVLLLSWDTDNVNKEYYFLISNNNHFKHNLLNCEIS